ncbi:hypothetical protein V2J09_013897 [Rumex salicifolius]
MEKLALASAKPVLLLDSPSSATRTLLPLPLRSLSKVPKSRVTVRAKSNNGDGAGCRVPNHAKEKLRAQIFASVSSTIGGGRETSSVGVNPPIAVPPPSTQFGSPLFWIGVGVGFSALFSWLASYLKNYAMQQAFKTMMGQMGSQNSQFGNSAFPAGSPFSYPPSTTGGTNSPGSSFTFPPSSATQPASQTVTTTTSRPVTTPSSSFSKSAITLNATSTEAAQVTDVKVDEEMKFESKKIAFEDVSPDEGLPKSPFENFEESSTSTSSKDVQFAEVVTDNGSTTSGSSASNESWSTRNADPVMSVEALEKMMEDPTVQKMKRTDSEYANDSHLHFFSGMLQNPEYRKQLQDMLNNMGGSPEWDSRMMDTMKNFDLSSPEVKQQFDQIGLTPEEVISKIMANPDVAMAFQNPRVQAAIMDCSQNPFNIAKYQNDKEEI